MKSILLKVGLILLGYVAAFFLACGAVAWNDRRLAQDVKDASAGMAAGGDLILFVFVFGLASLVPTGLGIYYLVWAAIKKKSRA